MVFIGPLLRMYSDGTITEIVIQKPVVGVLRRSLMGRSYESLPVQEAEVKCECLWKGAKKPYWMNSCLNAPGEGQYGHA